MSPQTVKAGVLCAAVLALVAACSTAPPPVPPRPIEIAIGKIKPCEMFSTSQQTELGLRNPTARVAPVNGQPSPVCTWTSTSGFGYNAQTIFADAKIAASETGATPLRINGFDAVRRTVDEFTGGAPTCQVTVDAAEGGAIRVQTQAVSRQPPPSDEEMCRLATDAASKVMTTVVATAAK